MITCICGLPGHGKGLQAVQVVLNELRQPDGRRRLVVTNLALNLGNLQAWWDTHEKTWRNVAECVRIIGDSDLRRFWRQRPGGVVLGVETPVVCGGKTIMDESAAIPPDDGGVLYVLDEVQIYYHARRFAEVSREATWYLSQHRHFGDDVVLITQSPEMIDKQLRVLVDTYYLMRHAAKRTKWGLSTGQHFKRLMFYGEPSPGVVADGVAFFRLPEAVTFGNIYSTAAGSGIAMDEGAKADAGRKLPGVPVKVWVLGLLLGIGIIAAGGYALQQWVTTRALNATLAVGRVNPRATDSATDNGSQAAAIGSATDNVAPATGSVHWNVKGPETATALWESQGRTRVLVGGRWFVAVVEWSGPAGDAGGLLPDGREWVLPTPGQALGNMSRAGGVN